MKKLKEQLDNSSDDINKIVDIGNVYPHKSIDFDYDLDVACTYSGYQEPHTISIKAGDKTIGKSSSYDDKKHLGKK